MKTKTEAHAQQDVPTRYQRKSEHRSQRFVNLTDLGKHVNLSAVRTGKILQELGFREPGRRRSPNGWHYYATRRAVIDEHAIHVTSGGFKGGFYLWDKEKLVPILRNHLDNNTTRIGAVDSKNEAIIFESQQPSNSYFYFVVDNRYTSMLEGLRRLGGYVSSDSSPMKDRNQHDYSKAMLMLYELACNEFKKRYAELETVVDSDTLTLEYNTQHGWQYKFQLKSNS